MAFSQSLEIGNSTFMNIEKQVKQIIRENIDKCKENRIDVTLGYSPAANYATIGKTCSVDQRCTRRSKSDSTMSIGKVLEPNENYSELFRSEFTFDPSLAKSNIELSQVRAPQLGHANIQSVVAVKEVSSSVLEPIFLEAAHHIFETKITTNMSLQSSALPENDISAEHQDVSNFEYGNIHDTSRFICTTSHKEALKQIEEELQISRRELSEMNDMQQSCLNNTINNKTSSRLHRTAPKLNVLKNSAGESSAQLPLRDLGSLKHISAWNLPQSILIEYEKKHVVEMFDWQIECLSNPKVLFEHCNLVYSAPTSAGKTLVSEILLLKTVLERGKKVLMILPFISVVREKMFYLQDLLTTAGYRVEGFFGGYTPPGSFESINVAICTIEKANSIVNKLLEQRKLKDIGCVIVDEVHLISDPCRGYILELLLAKILYMSRKYAYHIQVITMSATLANVELLKHWLDAELYITDFRPVALQEMIKIGNKIFNNQMEILRDITKPVDAIQKAFQSLQNDSDHVVFLCLETLLESCSVIVFCPSKDWCENLALQLATAIRSLLRSDSEWGSRLRAQINNGAIDDMKKQLRDIPTGLDSVLEKTIAFACAFHHAGLTTEERDIVEANFKSGAIKIIVATSTLSSGVNLPARRVIIRSPLFGGKQMSSLNYRQMIGRAGRTGKDTLGESILICSESNARIGRDLITAELKPISSCLEMDGGAHLKRALLEVISSGVVSTKDELECFVNCTLLSTQKKGSGCGTYIDEALNFIIEYEFVRLQVNCGKDYYIPTRLGMACLASSMPPTDGLILFAELQKSRRCFVLESELHAVYLVTPYSVCHQLQNLDWLLYLDLWEKLTPTMKKVGELVGVKESFLVRAMRGQTKLDYKLMQIHKRFYTALALQELVNETPINTVAMKYKCTRGMLQSLQQISSTFAGIVTAFCNSLQWSTLSLIVSQFKERLYFGVHRDLIDLMRLPDLSRKRARALFDAGIETIVDLAHSDIFTVEKVLYNTLSFDSDRQNENENSYEMGKRISERNFFITGKTGLTVAEAAKLLVDEARQFMEHDLGVGAIKWSQQTQAKAKESDQYKVQKSWDENKKTSDRTLKRKSNEKKNPSATPSPKVAKETVALEIEEKADVRKLNSSTFKLRFKEKLHVSNNKEQIKTNTAQSGISITTANEPRRRHPLRYSQERITTKEISPTVSHNIPETLEYHHPESSKLNTKPRRSPRLHHLTSKSTSYQKTNSNKRQNESFEISEGITFENNLQECGRSVHCEKVEKSYSVNISNEEIQSSQNLQHGVESPIATALTQYNSRYLRSMRIGRMNSPKTQHQLVRQNRIETPFSVEEQETTVTASSSIEFSSGSLENMSIQNPIQLNASHIMSCSKVDTNGSNFKYIEILDICGDQKLFKAVFKELMAAKRFGLCLALQQQTTKRKPLIGANVLINQMGQRDVVENGSEPTILFQIDDASYLAGVAFCISENIVYYMNMQMEGSCKTLTAEMKCKYLSNIFKTPENTLIIFDAKEQLKILSKVLPEFTDICCIILQDPKVANWLLQPDKSISYHHMVQQFAPECMALVNLCGSSRRGYSSFGLDARNAILAKVRSSIEACVNVRILKGQIENLERIGSGQLYKFFNDFEMPLQISLWRMELAGFPASKVALCKLFEQMMDCMKRLEARIYELHGSRFNLGSSQAVARVLGLQRKTSGGRVSTSRQILEKIDSPLSQLIIAYRKLSVTMTKSIQPLLKCIQNDRIHGQSITFTSTGRISMSEPNLQNIAKDFDIEFLNSKTSVHISCRNAFFPADAKRCLISADFCQLEMRILAHLSQDSTLLEVMNAKNDIFIAIAARWNKLPEDRISEQLRNGTKQICYGIVYGMGMRSLADALKCTEQEAIMVSQQFHTTYPGIRAYAERLVNFARSNGYIETITGRRRYLEHINSAEPQLRNQAERQAINSAIQGSAADIAKNAILRMETNILKYHEKLNIAKNAVQLVLHLHDELIFEVPEDKAKKVAKLLNVTMENCVKLNVPLKVKLKIGRSWGEMKEIKF